MSDQSNSRNNSQNQSQSQSQNEPQNQPEAVLRDGNFKASIWRNEGDNGAFRSTTFARTYEDREGNLRDTHSFAGTDLLKVAELARGAYARSNEMRRAEFKEQRRAETTSNRSRQNDRGNTR